MSQITDFDRLMADVAAGSEDAAMELAETYTPYIVTSVRRHLGAKYRKNLDSQDVAQALWASLLLQPGELLKLKTPEQFIAYLVQATKNKVAEQARRMRMQKRDINREVPLETNSGKSGTDVLHARQPSPSTQASLRERWRNAMANATARDRQIVTLLFQRHTYDEIGSILSIHEHTARRAMQKLIEQFTD